MSVNAIGHYYAINQLYPLIRKTSKLPNTSAPRIIFESSEMHVSPTSTFDATTRRYRGSDSDRIR